MAQLGTVSAVEHAECPICFEDLCTNTLAIFEGKDKKRTCRHFFHYDCLKEVFDFATGHNSELQCPVCRADCDNILEMPNIVTSAERWFELADTDASGNLSIQEVTDVVRATCNISDADAENVIKKKWAEFDKDGDLGIDWGEFSTLLAFVRENIPESQKVAVPSITESKEKWFKFWDQDNSSALEKDEVARALIKTFRKDAIVRVQELQDILECVWPLFDPNGDKIINLDEFLSDNGLAKAIVACLNYTNRQQEKKEKELEKREETKEEEKTEEKKEEEEPKEKA
eukprot:TRINITY_DN751_c1_g1_i1.p1 TRINITY_DN751_c1_g1~~TRINITY_DN751_c1_g1_i1.p1  ORF type:complete len:302 (+),score=90.44 TRINITY_DN751_c1_g1_i1:51-908(+)